MSASQNGGRVKSRRGDPQKLVRIAPDIMDFIKQQAGANGRSDAAQINLMLRKAMSMPAANEDKP